MPRPLATLPKAHLHLHFTGAMRHPTLVELAGERGIHLPEALAAAWPPRLSGTDERGWFRFQRLYDIARSVLTDEPAMFRLLRETAQDEKAEGSGWLEIQVDPSGYASRFGGLTPTVELVLAAAQAASAATGVGIGVIIAANRTKHPLEARTLARLAGQYAGRGVIGFGLSNDERRGAARDFAAAFRIAARPGLLLTPHGGELAGPASVLSCLDDLHADRPGRPQWCPGWTACTPAGSATVSPPWPTGSSPGAWAAAASRWRCAPPAAWRWGWPPRPVTCRCAPCSRTACRWRWARTARCCSG